MECFDFSAVESLEDLTNILSFFLFFDKLSFDGVPPFDLRLFPVVGVELFSDLLEALLSAAVLVFDLDEGEEMVVFGLELLFAFNSFSSTFESRKTPLSAIISASTNNDST